jgi:hypothetical protein
MPPWHHINKKRDDKSLMGVERVSWDKTAQFSKYGCIETRS